MEYKGIYLEAKAILLELIEVISNLTNHQYTTTIEPLSNASIGEHVRHIIELFQQLEKGYSCGEINYDQRKRNLKIQSDTEYAKLCIIKISKELERPNKELLITSLYNNQEEKIASNYKREVMFNIEHCIHHQAIIKIGIYYLGLTISKNFGVAKSTILYRNCCHKDSK